MRLFVAVTPPAAAVDHLAAALAAAREIGAANPPAEPLLRWVRPAMWHLTLAFFGEVTAETQQAGLQERLARAAHRHPALVLQFRGAGAFNRPARASVVWIGVDGTRDPLGKLAASCAAAGRRVGIDVEKRSYRPHLTVARAKGREPVDVRTLVTALGGYAGPMWTAAELHLIRSHLGPDPRYDILARWPLRGA
jgi:RNA 2',3'-cyclic 3'-phosphodiesterase